MTRAQSENAYQNYEDRPINATGKYDLGSIPLDEIEVYDNYSEVELASMDRCQLNMVKQLYNDVLNSSTSQFMKKKTIEVEEDAARAAGKNQIISQRQADKDVIKQELGEAKYQDLYDCLVFYRSQENTNEQEMYAEIRQKCGGVKEFLALAFRLDNIVFHEIVLENLGGR